VLLFDVLLVRTVPPTFFALISYQLIGLNDGCDSCLLVFAAVLVLTNVVASLIAMVVGAFRFSTAFSNLVGALLALLFALFAGFVVSKKAMADQGVPLYLLDPMSYAYEALLINQVRRERERERPRGRELDPCFPSKPLTTPTPPPAEP
jgi:ATP-binding cassette subfamily G (WHITE) protein 2